MLLPFENVYAIILHDNDFPPPKEESRSGNSVLFYTIAVRSNTQVLIKLWEFKFDPTRTLPNLSNNHKVLTRVKSCEDDLWIFLEDVETTEGSMNKDRYES